MTAKPKRAKIRFLDLSSPGQAILIVPHAVRTPAIVLPMMEAILVGARGHREHLLNSERRGQTIYLLSMVGDEIKSMLDWDTLNALLNDACEIMFRENLDWYVDVRFHESGTPEHRGSQSIHQPPGTELGSGRHAWPRCLNTVDSLDAEALR